MKVSNKFHIRKKGSGKKKLRRNPRKKRSLMSPGEEDDYDPDMAYEMYRDDWGDRLDDDAEKLVQKFVKVKGGYYSGNPGKFLKHLNQTLRSKLK